MEENDFEFIRAVQEVFPEMEIIVETPDRSDEYREQFIEPLKAEGMSGRWIKIQRG